MSLPPLLLPVLPQGGLCVRGRWHPTDSRLCSLHCLMLGLVLGMWGTVEKSTLHPGYTYPCWSQDGHLTRCRICVPPLTWSPRALG